MKSLGIASIYIVISLALISCENKITYKQAIKRSYGNVVNFSWNKQFIQEDTTFFESSSLQTPIKIVSYIDKMLCDQCFAKYLHGASKWMTRFPSDSVKYICVVASRTEDQLKECMTGVNSESCVVIRDTEDSFVVLNSLERHSSFCRTFLLDANNRVLLTGDPLRQIDLQKLYIDKINKLIKQGGVADGEFLYDTQPIRIRQNKIDFGAIHIGDTATFDILLRNVNRRPVSVVVEPECECTTVTPKMLTVSSKSSTKVRCSVVVDDEGSFVKYLFIRTNNSDDFQTVSIIGTAVSSK